MISIIIGLNLYNHQIGDCLHFWLILFSSATATRKLDKSSHSSKYVSILCFVTESPFPTEYIAHTADDDVILNSSFASRKAFPLNWKRYIWYCDWPASNTPSKRTATTYCFPRPTYQQSLRHHYFIRSRQLKIAHSGP